MQQLRSSDLGPPVVRVLREGSRLYYRRWGRTVIPVGCWLTCDTTGLGGPYSLFVVADLPTQQVRKADCSLLVMADLPTQQVWETHVPFLVVANSFTQDNEGTSDSSLRFVGTELVGGQAQVTDSEMAEMLNTAAQVGEITPNRDCSLTDPFL